MELFILFLVVGAVGVFWINYVLNKRDINRVEETAPYKVEEPTIPATVAAVTESSPVTQISLVPAAETASQPTKVKKPRTKPAPGAKTKVALAPETQPKAKKPAKKPAAKKPSKVVTKSAAKRK